MSKTQTDYTNIAFLEVPPKEDWFFETIGPQGQPLVYLRFQSTGLVTRRVGPFASREKAVWFLDMILDSVTDGLFEAYNSAHEHMVRIPFQRRSEAVTQEGYFTFVPDPQPKQSKPKLKAVAKGKATRKTTPSHKPSKRKAA